MTGRPPGDQRPAEPVAPKAAMTAVGKAPRVSSLPLSIPPIGISREQCAELIGVSTTKWDEMVRDGRMPKPKKNFDGRRVWDRRKVERAFEALDGDEDEGDLQGRFHA